MDDDLCEVTSLATSPSQVRRRRRRRAARRDRYSDFRYITRYGRSNHLRGSSGPVCSPDKYLQEWMDNFPRVKRAEFWDYEMRPSDLSAQIQHLKHFDHPPWTSPDKFSSSISVAISRLRTRLNSIPKMRFCDLELDSVLYNPNASPGFGYPERTSKKDVYPEALTSARVGLHKLLDGEWFPHRLIKSAGRSALRAKTTPREVKRGRLVWGVHFVDHLLNGLTAQAISDAVIDAGGCGTALGRSFTHGGVFDYADKFCKARRILSMDISRYDGSIDPKWISCILDIVRGLFEDDSDRYDMYWEYVFQSIVHPSVVLPDGEVLQPHVGMVSGHPYTSLLESLLTVMLTEAVVIEHARQTHGVNPGVWNVIDLPIALEALGDDIILGAWAELSDIDVDICTRLYNDMFNILISGEKSTMRDKFFTDISSLELPILGANFLSKHFVGYSTYRPTLDSQLIAVHPEGPVRSAAHSYAIMVGLLIDNPSNGMFQEWGRFYLEWMDAVHGPFNQYQVLPPYVANAISPSLAGKLVSVQLRIPDLEWIDDLYSGRVSRSPTVSYGDIGLLVRSSRSRERVG